MDPCGCNNTVFCLRQLPSVNHILLQMVSLTFIFVCFLTGLTKIFDASTQGRI